MEFSGIMFLVLLSVIAVVSVIGIVNGLKFIVKKE
jgi:ABC-type lipoprotein release transport system permease subunit